MKAYRSILALAAVLLAAPVLAETVRVTADKVNLRSQPSTTGRVLGTVEKGALLELLARSGDWMRVRTGDGQEGFIHSVLVEPAGGAAPSPPASAPPQPVAKPEPQAPRQSPPARSTVSSPAPQTDRKDTLGIGVCLGGYSFGVGGGLRYWSEQRLGFGLCVDHHSVGFSAGSFGSSDSSVLQVSPGVLFKLTQPETTSGVSITPYVGGGVSITRSSVDVSILGETVANNSATSVGAFGLVGVEFRFGESPFGISGVFGYYTTSTPFDTFSALEIGGTALTAEVHWYLK